MSKYKVLNRTLWQSLFSFRYYRDVIKAPFSFSLKFFLAFSFFTGMLITISLSLAITKPLQEFTARFRERAYGLYPQDLVVTVKNGQLSTNVTEPFHFPIPFELFVSQPPALSDQKQLYLFTIDTKADSSAYKDSKSFVFITRDSIVYPSANNEAQQVIFLKDVDDLTLDKTKVDQFIGSILPFLNVLLPLTIGTLAIFLLIVWPLTRLTGLFFLSLFLLPFARFMKLSLPFKKIYQVSLHSQLLPLFIQMTMFLFNVQPPILFFNSILFVLYNLIIFAELKSATSGNSTV